MFSFVVQLMYSILSYEYYNPCVDGLFSDYSVDGYDDDMATDSYEYAIKWENTDADSQGCH